MWLELLSVAYQLAFNSFEASFLPAPRKAELIARLQAHIHAFA